MTTVPENRITTLENQKIVVAGGTSGIGLALVEQLAGDKARLVALGRDPVKLKALEKRLPSVKAVGLNAADRSALDAFFSEEGELDHLVLAVSGANGAGPFNTLELSDLRQGFENKFWAQLNTIQAALPWLRRNGSVTLITAASTAARLPGTAGLAAINGALEIMVPILAKDLKPLRVNAVSPGVIDTPWWNFLPEEAKKQAFENYGSRTGVGRVGRPEEVAATIRFILSTEYINGVIIPCHGGLD